MVKFGIGLVPEEGCNLSVEHSVRAEKAGLDYIFMSDHLKGRNVHVCLTAVAYSTKRIMIGPGITNPYLTHPVTTAQILSSINEIVPNRVVCGIGAGDKSNLRRIGVKQIKPVAAVRDAIYIIRTILAGRIVKVEGKHFKISNVKFDFPKATRLPLLIGAQGDKMLKLAGEVADGVIINAAEPRECGRAVKIVRRSGKEAGRSMKNFELAAAMPFSISTKANAAFEPLLPKVAVVAAGCDSSVLERLEISIDDRNKVRDAVIRDDYDEMIKSVTPEMVDMLSIAGTPDTCIEKISRLVNSGITLVVLSPPLGPVHDEAINLIATEILQKFK